MSVSNYRDLKAHIGHKVYLRDGYRIQILERKQETVVLMLHPNVGAYQQWFSITKDGRNLKFNRQSETTKKWILKELKELFKEKRLTPRLMKWCRKEYKNA